MINETKHNDLIDALLYAIDKKNGEIFVLNYELEQARKALHEAENKAAELIAANNNVLCKQRIGAGVEATESE